MEANPATTVVCTPWLSDGECDAIARKLARAAWSPGRVAVPGAAAAEHEIRRCAVAPATDRALLARLEAEVHGVNARTFRFDLDRIDPDDPVLAMRYHPGDHFAWHVDNGTAAPPVGRRKLSFTVQVSAPDDYDGGDLEFAMYTDAYGGPALDAQRAQGRARGSLIVFPSFHLHRVAPVTRGVRLALVGWIHGPPFR